MSPGTTTAELLDGNDASAALDLLATLVLDAEARRAWLVKRDSEDMSLLFDEVFLLIGGLRGDSNWEVDLLLSELGCNKRGKEELEGLEFSDLESCCAFLTWITELVNRAPDQQTKRALIATASCFYADAGRELESCKTATAVPVAGDHLTPAMLIELGEIGTAFQFAKRALANAVGERAREVDRANPFHEFPKVHIRTPTLDALIQLSYGTPGASITFERAGRLSLHLRRCDPCEAAYKSREIALGFDPSPPPISFKPLPAFA